MTILRGYGSVIAFLCIVSSQSSDRFGTRRYLERVADEAAAKLEDPFSGMLLQLVNDYTSSTSRRESAYLNNVNLFAQALTSFIEGPRAFGILGLIGELISVPDLEFRNFLLRPKIDRLVQLSLRFGVDFVFACNALLQLQDAEFWNRIYTIESSVINNALIMDRNHLAQLGLADLSLKRRYASVFVTLKAPDGGTDHANTLVLTQLILSSQIVPGSPLEKALVFLIDEFEQVAQLNHLLESSVIVQERYLHLYSVADLVVQGIAMNDVAQIEAVLQHDSQYHPLAPFAETRLEYKVEILNKIHSSIQGEARFILVPKLTFMMDSVFKVRLEIRVVEIFVDIIISIANTQGSLKRLNDFVESLFSLGSNRKGPFAVFRSDNIPEILNAAFFIQNHFGVSILGAYPELLPSEWSADRRAYIQAILEVFTYNDGFLDWRNVKKILVAKATDERLFIAHTTLYALARNRIDNASWRDSFMVTPSDWLNDFLDDARHTRWAALVPRIVTCANRNSMDHVLRRVLAFPSALVRLSDRINDISLRYSGKSIPRSMLKFPLAIPGALLKATLNQSLSKENLDLLRRFAQSLCDLIEIAARDAHSLDLFNASSLPVLTDLYTRFNDMMRQPEIEHNTQVAIEHIENLIQSFQH